MTTVVNFVCDRTPDQNGCRFIECENEHGESIKAGEWRLRADGLVELHVELSQPPIIQTLHDNADLIALQATIARQAKMIEHLRGGLGNEPQLVSYAEDMSTCTLTTGDGTGYFYDRVDADQPALYTAVDMANAARDGFRDGAESKEKIIDALLNHCEDGECHVCSQIICPHANLMHFHHDGCPSCAQDEPE